MTATEIQNLVLALPSDSPYFRLALRQQSCDLMPSLSKRLATALSDFSLGWHVASAYAAEGLPLPDFPWPPAVLRAYRLLREEDYRDDNLVMAHCLNLPGNPVERNLLRAMLACQGAKYQEIAEVFQCEVEAIQLHEALFCDVRDRGDLLDREQLLGATHWSGGEPETFEQSLLHLALETGDATAVLKEAGIRFLNQPKMSVEKLAEQIEQDLITPAIEMTVRRLFTRRSCLRPRQKNSQTER